MLKIKKCGAFAAPPLLRRRICGAARTAAANKLKRRIGHKLADEMKNHLSTMALILSWYAEGQSHEQQLRTVLPRILDEHMVSRFAIDEFCAFSKILKL